MKIKTIEISGFVSCFNTLRKPYKKECRSVISSNIPVIEYETKNNIELPQWQRFIEWVKTLPLANELIFINENTDNS